MRVTRNGTRVFMPDQFNEKAVPPRIDVPKHIFEPLSPYNWDFRTIPDSLWQYAIKFEYVRSWPEFRAAAIAWLEKEIDGRTIRAHLLEASSKGLHDFTEKVWEALPKDWYYAFLDLIADPAYPVPLTWLLEKGMIRERPAKPLEPTIITVPGHPGKSLKLDTEDLHKSFIMSRLVAIHPMNKRRVGFVSQMLSFPNVGESHGYHLEISFDGHRNEDLVKAFAFWLKGEAKKARKVKVQGRASSPKWHRLKQLAAKRLSDAGQNHKDALRLIDERKKIVALDDQNEVLPQYKSPGAWHDAIKEANEMVEKMKRNFIFEDWELL